MKTVALPAGERVAAFGQGRWNGETMTTRAEEIATLRLGLDLVRPSLIRLRCMARDGPRNSSAKHCGSRHEAFLVSKVYPHNASRRGAIAACERSLQRLRTDRIDLYLLHWLATFRWPRRWKPSWRLPQSGKIRHYGVSNLDVADMQDLWSVPGGPPWRRTSCSTTWCARHRMGLAPMAPQASHPHHGLFADRAGQTRSKPQLQISREMGNDFRSSTLAWLLANDDVIVIPKTSRRDRLKENLGALDHKLTTAQLAAWIACSPTKGPQPLEML